jgi:hypothetical protein
MHHVPVLGAGKEVVGSNSMEVNLTHGPVLLLEIRNGFCIRASTEIKEIEIPRSESNEEDMALGRMLGQAHGP